VSVDVEDLAIAVARFMSGPIYLEVYSRIRQILGGLGLTDGILPQYLIGDIVFY